MSSNQDVCFADNLVRLRVRRVAGELRAHLREGGAGPVPGPEGPQSKSVQHPQHKRLGVEETRHRIVNWSQHLYIFRFV
jgi:hypothetical protein